MWNMWNMVILMAQYVEHVEHVEHGYTNGATYDVHKNENRMRAKQRTV